MSWNDRYRLQLDLQTILTQPPLPTYMRTSAMVRLGETDSASGFSSDRY